MSDPVTNAEVEDVLSSIRRLVSEDKRPLQAKQSGPANDRLVLTPALRVAEMPIDKMDVQAAEDRIVSEMANLPDDTALFDDPAHDYEADPYNFADGDDLDGDNDEKECLSDAADALEDDLSEDPDFDRVDDTETDQHETDQHEDADHIDASADDDAPISSPATSSPATLSAKIEALETAIGNIADTWEPDTPGADDYSGTEAPAMAWEDDVDRDGTGTPLDMDNDTEEPEQNVAAAQQDEPKFAPQPEPVAATAPVQDPPEQDGFAYGSDDQLIDEEALRDLISDIVRAELQGALGERITRNVRKLVRREIHRALTAQELE